MARMEREGSSRWKLPRLLESFAQGEEGSPLRGGDPALLFAAYVLPPRVQTSSSRPSGN